MARPKKWAPSAEQRKTIEGLSGIGMTHDQIAGYLGVHYNTWLDAQKKDDSLRQIVLNGAQKGNAKVHETLYQMATRGDCPAATIFWMKVRSRWKEPPQSFEHSGPGGKPIESVTAQSTLEELQIEAKKLEKKLNELG